MVRQVLRNWIGVIACAAALGTVVSVSAPISASASTVANLQYALQNVFNQYCLDGRLGQGNVTLQPCGADGTHEYWTARNVGVAQYEIRNVFNGECLDGRFGTGNVTLQPCGADGTHEYWQFLI
jgi:hypothetical protein